MEEKDFDALFIGLGDNIIWLNFKFLTKFLEKLSLERIEGKIRQQQNWLKNCLLN
jgi:hypothetical protein